MTPNPQPAITRPPALGSLQLVVLLLSVATTAATWLAFMLKVPALRWSAEPLPFEEIGRSAWGIGPTTDTTAFLAALLLAYVALAWVVWTADADLPAGLMLTTSALSGVFALFTYALFAEDVNVVLASVWTYAMAGFNPYVVTPNMVFGNPFSDLTAWGNLEYVYGPAWLPISGGLMKVIGPNVVANVMSTKVLMLGTLWVMGVIAWSLARVRGADKPVAATALVVLNPLLLTDGVMTPHLDLPMAAAIMAALLAWASRREGDAIALFALSIAIKFITVVLAPLVGFGIAVGLLFTGENRRRRALITVASLAATALAMAALWPLAWKPFLDHGMQTSLEINSNSALIPNVISGLQAAGLLSEAIAPVPEVKAFRWPLFLAFWTLATALGALVAWKRSRELPYALCPPLALIMLGYHLLFTIWFLPWHLLTALCVCLIGMDRTALLAAVLITVGGMLLYLNAQWVWVHPWSDLRAISWILSASLVSGPIVAALVLAASTVRGLQVRPSAPK